MAKWQSLQAHHLANTRPVKQQHVISSRDSFVDDKLTILGPSILSFLEHNGRGRAVDVGVDAEIPRQCRIFVGHVHGFAWVLKLSEKLMERIYRELSLNGHFWVIRVRMPMQSCTSICRRPKEVLSGWTVMTCLCTFYCQSLEAIRCFEEFLTPWPRIRCIATAECFKHLTDISCLIPCFVMWWQGCKMRHLVSINF